MEEKTTTSRMAGPLGKSGSIKNMSSGRSWLLGIGINRYQHFPNLNNAVRDVKDIIAVLEAEYDLEPENVITLFDEEATRNQIIIKFDQLKRRLKAANEERLADKLIIYYSGHGHLDEYGKGFWIPTDAEKDNTAHYIRNSTIRDYIEDFQTLHTLLISDSCFSGSLFRRSIMRSDTAIEKLERMTSRWALSSGRKEEEVEDGTPGDHSPFASSILQVLRENELPKLKVSTFIDQVMDLTSEQAEQLPEGYPLKGVGSNRGQYIFCKRSLEEEDWNNCRREDQPETYRRFLHQYPQSRYQAEVTRRVKELEAEQMWQSIQKNKTLFQYIQFVRLHPGSPHAKEAVAFIREAEREEETQWNQCREQDVLSAYLDYLTSFPGGQYVELAQKRIDDLQHSPKGKEILLSTPMPDPAAEEEEWWQKIKNSRSTEDFQRYLTRFPVGKHTSDANQKIELINKLLLKANQKTEEKEAWEGVKNKKLIGDFQAFLQAYPNSPFKAEAERKMEEIRAKRKKRSVKVPDSKVADWVKRGRKYLFGDGYKKNHDNALRLFKKAAAQGNATGQYYLGFMHDYGFGTIKDYKKAAYWYRKAAAQGQADAPTALGIVYDEGKGVKKDPQKALKWFRQAAEQGDALAQVRIGLLYFNGRGLPKDHREAFQWILKAANQGDRQAQYNMGILYAKGYGVAKDAKTAAEWYRKAAEQDYSDAQYNLGVIYEQGDGVPQNFREAAKWYQKAAEQGDASAQNNLGVLFKNGQGVSRNFPEALKWFSAAARQGDRTGQYNLGIMYRDGKGVDRNLEEAAKWFLKSAGQGNEEAQKALRELQNKSDHPESGVRGAFQKIKDFWSVT